MPQTRESGAAASRRGHQRARGLAELLGAEKLSSGANAVRWNGELAVIKSVSVSTNSFGITPTMEPKLDSLLAALEDKFGDVQVVRVAAADYRRVMYDGIDRPGGPLKMLRRTDVERLGRPIARYKLSDVEAAGL